MIFKLLIFNREQTLSIISSFAICCENTRYVSQARKTDFGEESYYCTIKPNIIFIFYL